MKEKLLSEIKDETFGIQAFEAAAKELNITNSEVIEELFDEMDTLRNKLESLRGKKSD